MTPNATELALIDHWQRDFPLVERPFAVAGQAFGLEEDATIDAFRKLSEAGILSRIGAVVRPHAVGASTLAAMQVPADRLAAVAAIVSDEEFVNHNYERTHAFNLWFVIAAPEPESVAETIERIEKRTALAVLNLPLLEAYHLDLGFSLLGERRETPVGKTPSAYRPEPLDQVLLGAIEDGLPIMPRPYREVAERIGVAEGDLLGRLRTLSGSGAVSRFGCVVRHRSLGYTSNAMAVWNVPDESVGEIAGQFARSRDVTLCYRRPRRLPDWPYNLFCMIHAKSRADAGAAIASLNSDAGAGHYPQAVLFSTRCFKQRGARFSRRAGARS